MHPAPSVILFTTLSGLGFGLLVFLGLGMPGVTGTTALAFFAIAYLLAGGGLLASTFHLGNPKNAIKAFSQWRTSWLSREALAAPLALAAMAGCAVAAAFFDTRLTALGWIGAALSLGTVFCTAMIYASLRAIPRWNQAWTPLHFLATSIAGGALLAGQTTLAIPLLLIAGAVQWLTWVQGDKRFAQAGTTLGTATGLGAIGTPRLFEPPHTGTNYLLREMVHVVGRKHSQKLRSLSLILGYALPALLLLLPFNHGWAALAVLSHLLGVLAARWLFFAQAEHVVGLYYGERQPIRPPDSGR